MGPAENRSAHEPDFAGVQQGAPEPGIKTAIAELGLEHRLLTQFTSFVVVEEMTLSVGGAPRRIEVPVEMPDGVRYEMFGFGSDGAVRATRSRPVRYIAPLG